MSSVDRERRRLLQAGALVPAVTGLRRAWAADGDSTVSEAGEAGTGGEAGSTSTIAAVFGTLPSPQNMRRVFAAGPPAAVLLGVLAPDRLMGWPFRLPESAGHLLSSRLRGLPVTGRLAGRGSTVSSETLLQLRPDLIVDIGTVDDTYRSTLQRVSTQTGLPCVLMYGRLHDHPAQLLELGRLLGVVERSRQLAAWATDALALAGRVRRSRPAGQRPRVYFGRGSDGLETGRADAIHLEVVTAVGGENVAAATGQGGLMRASLEQILSWDPEVIVTQDPEFARHALQDRSWRTVSAVRNGRVHLAPILPFGWLDGPPGVNRLIGLYWLLARLYPGIPGIEADLYRATADFYRLFYGVALSPDAVRALAGSPA